MSPPVPTPPWVRQPSSCSRVRSVVWKIAADGSTRVVAGELGGRYGVRLGPLPGRLNALHGLSVAPDGSLFVLDENAVLSVRQ